MRAVVAILAACGCGRIAFDPHGISTGDGGELDDGPAIDDAGEIDSAIDGAPPPPFGPPVLVGSLVDVLQTSNPTLTDDELEIFFVRRVDSTQQGDIYTATRATTAGAWGTPTTVAALNSTADESGIHLSRDGLTMWFASTRAGSLGGHDVYSASRPTRTQPFAAPVRVASTSSTSDESGVVVDGAQTYLVLNVGAAPRELRASQRADTLSSWSTPTLIPELDDPADDSGPELAADGLVIYFASTRAGSSGVDLWTATRPTAGQPFGAPTNVAELNSTASDSTIWISPDGHVIYFGSSRSGVNAIYRASR